ncbi:hypothetical protein BH10ACI3_BH10ACI3_08320 [soil metagenome]
MKTTLTIIVAAIISISLACSKPDAKLENKPVSTPATVTPAPAATASKPKDGNYPAKGTVIKIDLKASTVELKHDDIPGLMPAMQMMFNVRDKTQLDGLKVGDKVDFVLEYKDPTETVTSIKKTE